MHFDISLFLYDHRIWQHRRNQEHSYSDVIRMTLSGEFFNVIEGNSELR